MASQPNHTLYVNNINDKVNKEELRAQLYALFTTYGRLIDVVASKSTAKRGQAFLVFTDLASATAALRACNGMLFYDKPLHISYAKSKSYATLRREDPSFVPPSAANASAVAVANANKSTAEKRLREQEDAPDADRAAKREKADDDDGEEMEIDEDDESGNQAPAASSSKTATVPPVVQRPSARLLCTNLPQEVNDDVLSVLFQQYKGFQSTHVAQSPTAGAKVKMAHVLFDSPDLATLAKEALDGFTLKKGWQMSVAYI